MSSAPHSRISVPYNGLWTSLAYDALALAGLARKTSPWILALPAGVLGLVMLSLWSPWYSLASKDFQEVFAASVLGVATLTALLVGAKHRHTFLNWQLLLTAALFFRELHFVGTNNGIYVVLVVLLWYLGRHANRMQPYVGHRLLVSLLFGALWAYLLAKSFDRGYWRTFIPAIEPFRDSFEETLESTGHLLILALVWGSGIIAVSQSHARRARRNFRQNMFRWGWMTLLPVGIIVFVLSARSEAHRVSPTRDPSGLPFELSSLAEVRPELGKGLFLAGSDESRDIVLWKSADDGTPTLVAELELKIPSSDGSYYHLDDLEGITFDGIDTYYAASSHRQLSAEKEQRRMQSSAGTECALVSFQLASTAGELQIVNAQTVCRDLLTKIRKLGAFKTVNWLYPKSFHWRRLSTSWQIDLEGLAYVDGRILLGFKNPVEEGLAAVLAFDPRTDNVSLVGRYDFGGHGILGMNYDRAGDRLIVVTNDPLKGSYGDSRLWIGTRLDSESPWRFPKEPNTMLEKADANLRRKASGLVLSGDRMLVCFDDPARPIIRSFPLP